MAGLGVRGQCAFTVGENRKRNQGLHTSPQVDREEILLFARRGGRHLAGALVEIHWPTAVEAFVVPAHHLGSAGERECGSRSRIYPDGWRESLEDALEQRCQFRGRTRRFYLLHCIDRETGPVRRSGLITGMKMPHDAVEPGERRQIRKPGICQRARRLLGHCGNVAGEFQAHVIEHGRARIYQ